MSYPAAAEPQAELNATRSPNPGRPLKICFFNRSYWPDFGATGQLLTELAEDLVRDHGCDVSVVAGRPLSSANGHRTGMWPPVRRELRNGVRIFRASGTVLPTRRFVNRAANYLSYFAAAGLAGLQVPKPDVVVALTDPPIIGLAALAAARRHGARFVFLCQDVFPEVAALVDDFHNETVNNLLDRTGRYLVGQADRVIVLGDSMKDRLVTGKGADPSALAVIHNWADCEAIAPGPKRNPYSVAHGLADSFVVMHAGNVGLSQNLDTFLDAAARLRMHKDLVFVINGEGARKAALEARVHDEGLTNVIRFFPYQDRSTLGHVFATADVFVVSLKRGIAGCIVPSKIYPVLAAGRPFVAAVEPMCEPAVIAQRYDCGLVAEPGDPAALAERIDTLYRDRDRARRLGHNARQAAFDFDRKRQVRAHYELLESVARGGGVPGAGPTRGCRAWEPGARNLRAGVSFSRASSKRVRGKRTFDLLLSGFGLLVSAPLWGMFSLAIKLEDGGSVLYPQDRVGEGGRIFKMLKFRSMRPNAGSMMAPRQASENDPRITRVGRFLRATAMDELPQLWNIFRGDMSFVGPRPLLPGEIEVAGDGRMQRLEDIPGYAARHSMQPGLTGLTQVYAARDIPRRNKFRLDTLYIKRASFRLDLKLVTLSFLITFRGRWEHRGRKV